MWNGLSITKGLECDRSNHALSVMISIQGGGVDKKIIKQHETDRMSCDAAAEDAAWQKLKVMLERRITEGIAGGASAKSLNAILDEELGSRHPDT